MKTAVKKNIGYRTTVKDGVLKREDAYDFFLCPSHQRPGACRRPRARSADGQCRRIPKASSSITPSTRASTQAWADGFTKETGIKVTLRKGSDMEFANQIVAGRCRIAGRRVPDGKFAGHDAGRRRRPVRAASTPIRWRRCRKTSARRWPLGRRCRALDRVCL